MSTVNFFNELEKVLHIIFIGITDQDKYKQKQFLSQVLLHNFVRKIIAKKKPNSVVEYVCLHHFIIHFCTNRFDKLKYLSSHFFKKIAIFLEKWLVNFPKQMEIWVSEF